jgi:chromosome segregation ATPase
MAAIDELDYRTRFLESEIEGEKIVTRHVLRQAGFNADDLGTLKAEVRRLNEQMVLANAALNTQGGRLTLLTQDVTALRQDVTALRRGQEEIHARLDRQDSRLDAIDSRLDAMNGRLDRMENRLDRIENRLDRIENRLDTMERNIAAILAAVTPGNPPPA